MNDAQRQFQTRMERIESRIQDLERTADPQTLAASREVVRLLLELHAAGLTKVLEIARQRQASLVDDLAADDLLAHLLLLHDLHPVNLEERVQQALAPFHSQAEYQDVSEGVVKVRLVGDLPGCRNSAGELRMQVEQAILTVAPDASAVEFVDARTPAGFVAVESLWSVAR